ncbi:MAG: TetR/AcrR family transcriptional regulator [Solirubrobacteraceae bacterium]
MPPRKDSLILATAVRLFLERGYDATSIDEIAAASRVSKTTVYNNFDDKAAVFTAAMESVTARADVVIAQLEQALNDDRPVPDRLHTAAYGLVLGVLDPAVVQLRRLAITEAVRFPTVVDAYLDRAPARTVGTIEAALTRMTAAGELKVSEPRAAALQLAYAAVAPFQDRALMRPTQPIELSEIETYLTSVIQAFMRAHG